jgi:hypothetical protein
MGHLQRQVGRQLPRYQKSLTVLIRWYELGFCPVRKRQFHLPVAGFDQVALVVDLLKQKMKLEN